MGYNKDSEGLKYFSTNLYAYSILSIIHFYFIYLFFFSLSSFRVLIYYRFIIIIIISIQGQKLANSVPRCRGKQSVRMRRTHSPKAQQYQHFGQVRHYKNSTYILYLRIYAQ